MFTVIELKYYLVGCMKLPMNVDIYSIAFDFETIWRIVGGATGTRATNIKRPLGGLSNLFIFISGILQAQDKSKFSYRARFSYSS